LTPVRPEKSDRPEEALDGFALDVGDGLPELDVAEDGEPD
jgi:hypothetical protein